MEIGWRLAQLIASLKAYSPDIVERLSENPRTHLPGSRVNSPSQARVRDSYRVASCQGTLRERAPDGKGRRCGGAPAGRHAHSLPEDRVRHPRRTAGTRRLYEGRRACVTAEHIHPNQEERFEVLSGTAHFRMRGRERDIGIGEKVVIPAGTPHVWGNLGEEEAHLIAELRPALDLES